MGESAHGTLHWTELNTADPERAAAFYRAVLGWHVEAVPMSSGEVYHVATRGDGPVAGIYTMQGPAFAGMPDHWLSYFTVDDADRAAAAVGAAGGSVIRAPFDVPEVGRFVIVRDAGGAVMGLVCPKVQAG